MSYLIISILQLSQILQSLYSRWFWYLRKHLAPTTGLEVTNSASTEFPITRGDPSIRVTCRGGTLATTEQRYYVNFIAISHSVGLTIRVTVCNGV